MSRDGSILGPLSHALRSWNQRGRQSELLGPLFDWLLRALEAERVIFFTLTPGGGYRIRASRNADGETLRDPERFISHFAVRRTLDNREATFFAETRQDRRFRTEGEREGGSRTRSILVVPAWSPGTTGVLYFDSRFGPIRWPGDTGEDIQLVQDLLMVAMRLEASESERRALERKVQRLE
ncbi:MAG: GAF domain-containing protein, partial [Planctomycetota bacterium]